MALPRVHQASIDEGVFSRYPRVAVLLGVSSKWYVPLLLCRALSVTSAVWWALPVVASFLRRIIARDGNPFSVLDVLVAGSSTLEKRIARLEIILAFLWACTASYIAHLFASSLMSRWLLQYSLAAVLVRLTSLSLILSFGCNTVFAMAGASYYSGGHLDRALPLWIAISIAVLMLYFRTQHDISVDEDKDDRKRRLVLRSKCVNAIALTSTASLCALLLVLHLDEAVGSSSPSNAWSRALAIVGYPTYKTEL